MKALNVFLALFSCSFPLLAQTTSSPTQQACGDPAVKMAVDLDRTRHAIEPPVAGQATVYFIQESGFSHVIGPYPTTKIGIDGKWVGANNKNSYFSITLPPGEHHLCAATQSHQIVNHTELAELHVEAGKIYFYRSRIFFSKYGPDYLTIEPVNPDEARYLIESSALATASPKK